MKVKLSSSLPTLLAIALMGCGSSETQPDPEGEGQPIENPDDGGGDPNEAPAPDAQDEASLTGKWVRKSPDGGEVVFDCLDAGATLSLKRELTGNKDIKSYEVELERQGKQLKGTARFTYTEKWDPKGEEISIAWELTAKSDYVYDARIQAFVENEDGSVDRPFEQFTIEITPTKPKVKVTDPSKEGSAPAAPASSGLAPPKDEPVDEAKVKDQLADLFGDDEAKSKAAMLALRDQGAPADPVIVNASYDVEDPIKRARAGLILALRQNPAGLSTLQEVRSDASSLGIAENAAAERLYKLGIACLVPVPGLDRSPATIDKVLADSAGPEATAWAKKVDEGKPELLVLKWLKAGSQLERQTAEAILFPGGVALGGRYGGQDYAGELYNSLDENQERRDAAADQFLAWFNENARDKLAN